MFPGRGHDQAPPEGVPPGLLGQVNRLRWIRSVMSELKSLPDGKLKSSIEEKILAMTEDVTPPSLDEFKQLQSELESSSRQLRILRDEYKKLKDSLLEQVAPREVVKLEPLRPVKKTGRWLFVLGLVLGYILTKFLN